MTYALDRNAIAGDLFAVFGQQMIAVVMVLSRSAMTGASVAREFEQ